MTASRRAVSIADVLPEIEARDTSSEQTADPEEQNNRDCLAEIARIITPILSAYAIIAALAAAFSASLTSRSIPCACLAL